MLNQTLKDLVHLAREQEWNVAEEGDKVTFFPKDRSQRPIHIFCNRQSERFKATDRLRRAGLVVPERDGHSKDTKLMPPPREAQPEKLELDIQSVLMNVARLSGEQALALLRDRISKLIPKEASCKLVWDGTAIPLADVKFEFEWTEEQ